VQSAWNNIGASVRIRVGIVRLSNIAVQDLNGLRVTETFCHLCSDYRHLVPAQDCQASVQWKQWTARVIQQGSNQHFGSSACNPFLDCREGSSALPQRELARLENQPRRSFQRSPTQRKQKSEKLKPFSSHHPRSIDRTVPVQAYRPSL